MSPFTNSGVGTHQVVEFLKLGNFLVVLYFDAYKNERAVSDVKNSYFQYSDSKEFYNELGPNAYKQCLLKRIANDLYWKKGTQK